MTDKEFHDLQRDIRYAAIPGKAIKGSGIAVLLVLGGCGLYALFIVVSILLDIVKAGCWPHCVVGQ